MDNLKLHGTTAEELDRFKQVRGMEYLRELVASFNTRPEYFNDPKSVDRLISEFDDYCMELSNVNGHKYCYQVYNAHGYFIALYDNERAAQARIHRAKEECGDQWTMQEVFLHNTLEDNE